jgi:hypothetical protein
VSALRLRFSFSDSELEKCHKEQKRRRHKYYEPSYIGHCLSFQMLKVEQMEYPQSQRGGVRLYGSLHLKHQSSSPQDK